MSSIERMVRADIIVKGDVQRVGYRDAVERIARKMKLTGFVENIKPYDVRIVCEGYKESVELFIKNIKIKEFPIDVEEIEVRFGTNTSEFPYFEIRRGDWTEELGERIDAARSELKQNTFILNEFRKETSDNFKLLHSDFIKHDTETLTRITALDREISGLKERIQRVESTVLR